MMMMHKVKNIRLFQKYKKFQLKSWSNLKVFRTDFHFKILESKVTLKFIISLIMIACVIVVGLGLKICFFKLYMGYYVFLLSIYWLNICLGPNKYMNIIFSESNIIIKLVIPLILFILIDYNQILVSFLKFIFILAIRSCFGVILSFNMIILLIIICLCPNFIPPIVSLYLIKLCIFNMNPANTGNFDEQSLPDWYNRAQEEQDFWEHQRNLQEMLKSTEHGVNYKELIPQDVNDFNIAKANNALGALQKDLRGFHGHVKMTKLGAEILEKIKNNELMNRGSSVHSKLTYEQLAVLKHFGIRLEMQNINGYNGILQKGLFTNAEPNNIEISNSICPDSVLFSRLEHEISNHKRLVKDQIAATNNKTWIVN